MNILPVTARQMPYTFRSGCPVSAAELREVVFDHLGFDGAIHEGRIVVHQVIVDPLLKALGRAVDLGFPIHQAIPLDDPAFRGDDNASMAANNSSGFNFRTIAGTNKVSMHSLGLAVDINPLLNPYLAADGIWYPEATHVERSDHPGVFTAGHPLTRTFIDLGFEWGGSWSRPDFHHFQWSALEN